MIPTNGTFPISLAGAPHARGDDPGTVYFTAVLLEVLPTLVGMILSLHVQHDGGVRAPHARGDDPHGQ